MSDKTYDKTTAGYISELMNERDTLRARVEQMREALEEVQLHHGPAFSGTTREQVDKALSECRKEHGQ